MAKSSKKNDSKAKKIIKEKESIPILNEKLSEVFKKFNSKYSGKYISSYEDDVKLWRIPSGIFGIDVITQGGIPGGMMTLITGKEGTGKTYICYNIGSIAQKTCRYCHTYIYKDGCICKKNEGMFVLFINSEKKFIQKDWFESINFNFDIDKFAIVYPGYGIGHASNVILNSLETGKIDLVIIDSIAQLPPREDMEKDSEDEAKIAGLARKLNKFLRDYFCTVSRCSKELGIQPTLICVNQLRANVGVLYGKKTTMPGGLGQLYANSLSLETGGAKFEQENKSKEDGAIKSHLVQRAMATKAKFRVVVDRTSVGRPKGSTEFKIYLSDIQNMKKGMNDDLEWIIHFLKQFNYLENINNKWILKDIIDIEMIFNTQKEFLFKLIEDLDFRWKIREKLIVDTIKHVE